MENKIQTLDEYDALHQELVQYIDGIEKELPGGKIEFFQPDFWPAFRGAIERRKINEYPSLLVRSVPRDSTFQADFMKFIVPEMTKRHHFKNFVERGILRHEDGSVYRSAFGDKMNCGYQDGPEFYPKTSGHFMEPATCAAHAQRLIDSCRALPNFDEVFKEGKDMSFGHIVLHSASNSLAKLRSGDYNENLNLDGVQRAMAYFNQSGPAIDLIEKYTDFVDGPRVPGILTLEELCHHWPRAKANYDRMLTVRER